MEKVFEYELQKGEYFRTHLSVFYWLIQNWIEYISTCEQPWFMFSLVFCPKLVDSLYECLSHVCSSYTDTHANITYMSTMTKTTRACWLSVTRTQESWSHNRQRGNVYLCMWWHFCNYPFSRYFSSSVDYQQIIKRKQ